MSDYIVLVKQVPDVTQIADNCFDPESGTLIRSRLASVINDLDSQALAFANLMKTISNDRTGRIICLSMGPPMAEEVLKYCLSRLADKVILLTDRTLGGADTWATANPLAYAIRKIVKEDLNGSNDYYIVAGMQSVDGDTAQVPGQIAEELQLPCIAYVTGAEYKNNRFEFTKIISGGSQVVAAKKLPCVLTVAKYEYPLFATFGATRKANRTEIAKWTSNDVQAKHIGAKGSKTAVIRVFPPGKTTRKCQQISDINAFADLMVKSFKNSAQNSSGNDEKNANYTLPQKRSSACERVFETTVKENEDYKYLCEKLQQLSVKDIKTIEDPIKDELLKISDGHFHKKSLDDMIAGYKATEPSYKGEVGVAAEHSDGEIHPAVLELIGKARELADSIETKVGVCLVGNNVEPMAHEMIAAGADNIYLIEDPLLAVFDPVSYKKAFSDAIEKYWPQIVLFGATPQGRILAPMVSYKVECGLTADCTSLDIRDSSRKGEIAILLQTRPALGGNVMASICTKNSKSQMATARPGVMKKLPPDKNRKGNIIRHNVTITNNDITLDIIRSEKTKGGADLGAEIIISGGKGMQNRDNFEMLLGQLCSSVSQKLQTKVEKGATRAAVEHGFIDRVHQVGQTGTAVGPKIYVAIGISGAIQHMIGVANTETIFAVNSDPYAPIFKHCDYYILGKAEEIIPKLSDALRAG